MRRDDSLSASATNLVMGATFSCSAIPLTESSSYSTSSAVEGSCQIPLGFVFTPFQDVHLPPSNLHQPPFTITVVEDTASPALFTDSNPTITKGADTMAMMQICTKCLSYLNLYCPYDQETGRWTCCFCHSINYAPMQVFPSNEHVHPTRSTAVPSTQFMASSVLEYHQTSAGFHSSHQGTSNHQQLLSQSTVFNESSEIDDKNKDQIMMIVLDGNVPSEQAKEMLTILRTLVQSSPLHSNNRIKYGLVIFSSVIHIYQVGVVGIASADVFSPDDFNEHQEDVPIIRNPQDRMYIGSIDDVLKCATAYFGLDRTNNYDQVHLSHGKKQAIREKNMTRKELLQARRAMREMKIDTGDGNSNNNRKQFRQTVVENLIRNMEQRRIPPHKKKNTRCTWEAVSWAVNIILSQSCISGRIFVFTNGCPNIGKGSVVARDDVKNQASSIEGKPGGEINIEVLDPYRVKVATELFRATAKDAMQKGIGMDVFFCGSNAIIGTPVLLSLVEISAGYLLSYSSFQEERFASDFQFVLLRTFMSRSQLLHTEGDFLALRRKVEPTDLNTLNGCFIDIRMSSFLAVSHVVGPFTLLLQEEQTLLSNERSSFSCCASLAAMNGIATNNLPSKDSVDMTRTRLRMGRYDPMSTISVAFLMQDRKALIQKNRFAYFQFVVRYVNPLNERDVVTRVISQRIPIAQHVQNFLEGLNDDAVSVILGREAAYRSMSLQSGADDLHQSNGGKKNEASEDIFAQEARKDLDHTVHLISQAFRRQSGQLSLSKVSTSDVQKLSQDFAFPPELASTARFLHHLRRGSIIGQCSQSVDERVLVRDLFLRLPLLPCINMVVPLVWRCHGSDNGVANFEPLYPETMVLWDTSIVAVDGYSELFVWSGKQTLSPQYQSWREHSQRFLLERSRGRFPAPILFFLSEADSMARRLTTRLAPSHGDPSELLLTRYPQLGTLQPSEVQSLRDKFRIHDSNSDPSFFSWFWETIRANSVAAKYGKSLCE